MKFASFVSVLAIAGLVGGTATAQTLGIGTSNPGSITHSIGAAIAKILTEKAGLQSRVQPHGGNSATVPAVNAGEVDLGAANIFEIKYALTGTGIYKGQVLKDLRVVTVLMPLRTAFFVRKDSPIKSLADLRGKNVPGVFTSQKVVGIITRGVLANAGLSYKDVKMVPVSNVVRGADDFVRGKTDVFFFAVGSGKILQTSAKVGGVRALGLDPSAAAMARLNKIFPVGYALEIKPRKQNHGIVEPTFVTAFDLVFLTNSKVSEDVIYKVTKTLHGGKKAMFASFKPLGALFSPKRMVKKLPAGEYHPGAVRFYREKGMWPPK